MSDTLNPADGPHYWTCCGLRDFPHPTRTTPDCRDPDRSRYVPGVLPRGLRPALAVQEGGDHYKAMRIQPFEYIHANGIPFAEGCVIKYVSRWRAKGGVEDLKKARHFLDLLIEAEQSK